MTEGNEKEKKKTNLQDGSEQIRPENEKDFAGIKRAQNTTPREDETNEWEAREDESPTP